MTRVTALALLAAGCGALDGPVAGDATLKYPLAQFTVAPGSEAFTCRYFPPTGREIYASELHASLGEGAHHLLVYRIDATLGAPDLGQRECDTLDTPSGADALLYAAQEPISGLPLPDGVAMHLEAKHGLFLQAHHINAGQRDLAVNVEFGLTTVDKSAMRDVAGELFLDDKRVVAAPGTTTQTASCAAPRDMTVLVTTGHMHRRGVAFDATLDDQPIYHGDTWDSPVAKVYPAPGLAVQKGQRLRWTCTYANPTTTTFAYGNSALTNEMCIFGGIYYPAPDGFDNTWQCPNPDP